MFYLSNNDGVHGVTGYLESPRGSDMAGQIQILPYQDLVSRRELITGTYIFSDFDRLTPTQEKFVLELWDQLSQARSRVRLLNNPRSVLGRYDLLSTACKIGINDFRVFRATDDLTEARFPVFIRADRVHNGSLTELLSDQQDLHQALRRLTATFARYRRGELLVVEFCDTSGGTTFHQKYSAFKVGDVIIPRYVHTSENWVVKSENSVINPETAAFEFDYLTTNPHEDWIRTVFALANIDYGRIDYGIKDDRLQVWEINTNPMMGRSLRYKQRSQAEQKLRLLLEPGRQVAHVAFKRALIDLDRNIEPTVIPLQISSGTLISFRAENTIRSVIAPVRLALRKAKRFIDVSITKMFRRR